MPPVERAKNDCRSRVCGERRFEPALCRILAVFCGFRVVFRRSRVALRGFRELGRPRTSRDDKSPRDFGLDSVIETIAALALHRRLRAEQAGATEEEAEAHEGRARWIVGGTLFLLSGYVAFDAASTLWTNESPEVSRVGIILASVSLAVLPALAVAKHRTRKALDNCALIADTKETHRLLASSNLEVGAVGS